MPDIDRETTTKLGLVGLDIADVPFGYNERLEFTQVMRQNLSVLDNCLSSTTGSVDLYVSVSGSDSDSGSSTNPLRTINAALHKLPTRVMSGNLATIHVGAGTYDEKIYTHSMLLEDNVLIQGDPMVVTSPAQGITTGTFDAAWSTQMFPQRAVVTGAGWASGSLLGGFFVEVLDGTLSGTLLPIVNNSTDTVDFAISVDSGTYGLKGRQFRIVKPSTILAFSSTSTSEMAVDARAPSVGVVSTSIGSVKALTFDRFEFRRPATGAPALLHIGDACVCLKRSSFIDNATGGTGLITARKCFLGLEDCIFYRATKTTNTSFILPSMGTIIIGSRVGAYGGNAFILSSGFNQATIAGGFFVGQDISITSNGCSRHVLSGIGFDQSIGAVACAEGASVTLTSVNVKNCTSFGIGLGMTTASGYATSLTYPGGSVFMSTTTIDSCPTGILFSGTNCSSGVNTPANAVTITNCSSHGVNMASLIKTGNNNFYSSATTSMSGNGADFTVDGSVTLTLAALRALSPKRSIDASATFNRLVEL